MLHHGRGTDERDLLGLADALDPERRLHVVTPRAPLTLPGSPGYHWYLVPRVGYPDPDTFHAARAALAELHDRLWEETGVGPERTVLGGFSMGAVMSYAMGLGAERPRGRRDPRLQRLRPDRRGLGAATSTDRPATRGLHRPRRRDPIMEIGFAPRARELLEAGGLDGRVPRVRRRPPDRPRQTCRSPPSGCGATIPLRPEGGAATRWGTEAADGDQAVCPWSRPPRTAGE